MATQTTNFNLTKIELTDSPPDITVLNDNFDTIDAELYGAVENIGERASKGSGTVDANDLTVGLWYVGTSGGITRLNFPTSHAGILHAITHDTASGDRVAQFFYTTNQTEIFFRTSHFGTWSAWKEMRYTGTIPVTEGGTGATNATDARTNLGITPANIGAATSGHTHTLSGLNGVLSVEKGGTGNSTGNAATATTLKTARTIRTNLANTTAASFDGSANVTPGVTGTLPIGNGGTGATTKAGVLANLLGGVHYDTGISSLDSVDDGLYSVRCSASVMSGLYEALNATTTYAYANVIQISNDAGNVGLTQIAIRSYATQSGFAIRTKQGATWSEWRGMGLKTQMTRLALGTTVTALDVTNGYNTLIEVETGSLSAITRSATGCSVRAANNSTVIWYGEVW